MASSAEPKKTRGGGGEAPPNANSKVKSKTKPNAKTLNLNDLHGNKININSLPTDDDDDDEDFADEAATQARRPHQENADTYVKNRFEQKSIPMAPGKIRTSQEDSMKAILALSYGFFLMLFVDWWFGSRFMTFFKRILFSAAADVRPYRMQQQRETDEEEEVAFETDSGKSSKNESTKPNNVKRNAFDPNNSSSSPITKRRRSKNSPATPPFSPTLARVDEASDEDALSPAGVARSAFATEEGQSTAAVSIEAEEEVAGGKSAGQSVESKRGTEEKDRAEEKPGKDEKDDKSTTVESSVESSAGESPRDPLIEDEDREEEGVVGKEIISSSPSSPSPTSSSAAEATAPEDAAPRNETETESKPRSAKKRKPRAALDFLSSVVDKEKGDDKNSDNNPTDRMNQKKTASNSSSRTPTPPSPRAGGKETESNPPPENFYPSVAASFSESELVCNPVPMNVIGSSGVGNNGQGNPGPSKPVEGTHNNDAPSSASSSSSTASPSFGKNEVTSQSSKTAATTEAAEGNPSSSTVPDPLLTKLRRLQRGDTVKIAGLLSKPQLNGQLAKVIADNLGELKSQAFVDTKITRIGIQLISDKTVTFSVKLGNFEIVAQATPEEEGGVDGGGSSTTADGGAVSTTAAAAVGKKKKKANKFAEALRREESAATASAAANDNSTAMKSRNPADDLGQSCPFTRSAANKLDIANTSPELDVMTQLAAFAYASADYASAVTHYEKCRALSKDSDNGADSVHLCRFETALGNCKSKLRRGDEEVQAHFKAAMSIAHRLNDICCTFNALQGMGSHEQTNGRKETAETYMLQALELAQRSLGDLSYRDLAAAYTNLGALLITTAAGKPDRLRGLERMKQAEEVHDNHNPAAKGNYQNDSSNKSLAVFWANYGGYYLMGIGQYDPPITIPSYLMSAGQEKKGRKMLEDAINLSRIAGLKRAEQCAMINLVNSADDGGGGKGVRINDECCICMESLDNGKKTYVLECLHCFHRECFSGMVKQECPICRAGLHNMG